jgi:hypothetical protein
MTIPEQADIVKRLRDWEDYEPAKMFGGEILKDTKEAADEIERLRSLVGVEQTAGQERRVPEGTVPHCWAPWRALADAPVVPTKAHLKSTKLFLGSRYGSVGDAREIFQGDGHGNQCVAVAINGDIAERLVRSANASLMGVEQAALPPLRAREEIAALRELYEWYDRDGSVGAATDVFEKHRALLSTSLSSDNGTSK